MRGDEPKPWGRPHRVALTPRHQSKMVALAVPFTGVAFAAGFSADLLSRSVPTTASSMIPPTPSVEMLPTTPPPSTTLLDTILSTTPSAIILTHSPPRHRSRFRRTPTPSRPPNPSPAPPHPLQTFLLDP